MESDHPYATYRFAMCLIRGQFNKTGQNKDNIQEGLNLLNQISSGDLPCPEALTELGEIY